MTIGAVQPGTSRGTFFHTIGSRNGAAEDVAQRAVGRLPHLLEFEFSDARLVRSDGGAFDADAVFGDGVRGVDGNSGGAVSPTAAGNINVVGDGVTCTVAGNAGINTLTVTSLIPSLRCAFAGYLSATDNNATGDNTSFRIGSGNPLTITLNVGGGLNANGFFTAPFTGNYQLNCSCTYSTTAPTGGKEIAGQIIQPSIAAILFNFGFQPTPNQLAGYYGPNTYLTVTGSQVIKLNAGDIVGFYVSGNNGGKTDRILGGNVGDTRFSGFFIG